MGKKSLQNTIYEFIKNEYQSSQPFLLKDLYFQLPNIKQGTIRESIRRLINQGKMLKAKNGVYELVNPDRVLKTPVINVSNLIEKIYLKSNDNNIVGYRSGINFANYLGITSQTASVESIYSNTVSNRKREIKINKNRLIINAPRVEVTTNNYKLLQVLDLLLSFERYSEYDLDQVKSKLLAYIENINLARSEIENIVSAYPLVAQVKFYKIGGVNVITQG